MPASSAPPPHRPEDLIAFLSSAADDSKLKALRDLKNQIIGNRTKKLSFIKLGAVPFVVSILSSATDEATVDPSTSLLVQSAAAIGSCACGLDAGVKAVLDAGALPHLFSLLSHPNDKHFSPRSKHFLYNSRFTITIQASLPIGITPNNPNQT